MPNACSMRPNCSVQRQTRQTEPWIMCAWQSTRLWRIPQEKVDEAKEQILSGQNGVFDGVIETNTGETVGEAGKTLDDATITGGINWYFKTVNVVD